MSAPQLRPDDPRSPAVRHGPEPSLDYYLVAANRGQDRVGEPEMVLVEEFVFGEDSCAEWLYSAGWSPTVPQWWNASGFSRAMRADAGLRGRVTAVGRREAGAALRRLGGGGLPGEELLRTHFREGVRLSTSAPLRLTAEEPAPGFSESRTYRILFANEIGARGLAEVQTTWAMRIVADPEDPQARVIGTARKDVDGDLFTWDLRRVGRGIAWCLDLTVHLAGGRGFTIEPVLRGLITDLRRHGLIPAAVERFS